LESNKDSNKAQLESNKDSNKAQLESNKDSNKVQLESDKDSNKAQLESDKLLSESKFIADALPRVSLNERKILVQIINKMIDNDSNCTNDMNTLELTQQVGTTVNGLKTGLKRLTSKKILLRESGKRGVGGVIRFSTSTAIKNKLVNLLRDDIALINNNLANEKKSLIYNSNTTNTINKYNNDTKEQKPTNSQNDQLIDLIKKQNDQFQQQIAELQKQFLQQAPQTHAETKNVT
uniref:hypothetical protein n=1 Tax=Cysteiniphilum marinum TaxID=2774191 RepID=UPI00193B7DC9